MLTKKRCKSTMCVSYSSPIFIHHKSLPRVSTINIFPQSLLNGLVIAHHNRQYLTSRTRHCTNHRICFSQHCQIQKIRSSHKLSHLHCLIRHSPISLTLYSLSLTLLFMQLLLIINNVRLRHTKPPKLTRKEASFPPMNLIHPRTTLGTAVGQKLRLKLRLAS